MKKIDSDTVFIIIANLTTLLGVIFLNWSLFSVLFLYWLESAIIGFFNMVKMIIAPSYLGDYRDSEDYKNGRIDSKKIRFLKTILIPFFVIHYGIFMIGHLFFIYFVSFAPYIFTHNGYFPKDIGFSYEIFLPLLMLLFSHGFSFFKNFIVEKEYLKVSAINLMFAPYGRIILMHLTLFLGAGIATFLALSMQALNMETALKIALTTIVISIFIIFKTLVDIRAHSKEHSSFSSNKQ